ncbi:MAG: hypothetical protein KF886_04400 [Candidatus Hydrogenedentes bacterium]|nr:hypothetical protein [Candidatus Hydrogenedentota bacterium]
MDANRPNPIHFTYAAPNGDLQQGDLIERKELEQSGVIAELSTLPPNVEYIIVVTQSCDMVKQRIKADHIALVPAISLSEIIGERISKTQTLEVSKRAGICGINHKDKHAGFLKKLLNNNEPQYFYFHEEHQFSLEKPLCALLRRQVVVPTEPYYDRIVAARVLALNEEFRAKLGWLVGSIYGRVATQDWPEEDADEVIETILTGACGWEKHDRLKAAEQARKTGETIPTEKTALAEYIRNIHIPTRQEQILSSVREVMRRVVLSGKSGEEVAEEVCRKLAADAAFKKSTKQ